MSNNFTQYESAGALAWKEARIRWGDDLLSDFKRGAIRPKWVSRLFFELFGPLPWHRRLGIATDLLSRAWVDVFPDGMPESYLSELPELTKTAKELIS